MTPNPPSLLPGLCPWVWDFLVPYQRVGVSRAVSRGNYHLWWACGSGKTLAGLVWALAFPEPILVLTRASARGQWARDGVEQYTTIEPYTILPVSEQPKVYESFAAYRARMRLNGERPIVIAAWDALTDPKQRAVIDSFLALRPSVIGDELHVIKNHKHWTRTFLTNAKSRSEWEAEAKARDGYIAVDKETGDDVLLTPVQSIAGQAARIAPYAARRLALTATPMYDALRDLWAQLSFVEPGQHGKFWDWARHFCGAVEGEYGMETDGQSNVEALRIILSERTHEVTSEEVWKYLPPCERILTVIPQSEQGKEDGVSIAAMRAAVRSAGGSAMFDSLGSSDAKEAYRSLVFGNIATRKRPYVVRTLNDRLHAGQKCLIFTGLRVDAERTHEEFVKRSEGKFTTWMAHGETSTKEREAIRRPPKMVVPSRNGPGNADPLVRNEEVPYPRAQAR